HLELPMRMEAAIIADDAGDAVPHIHGLERDRHLLEIATERAHAGGRRARGVAADPVALEDDDAAVRPGKAQCGGEPMQPAADHRDIEALCCHSTHAAESVWSSAASSPSVTGLSGGRMR